jgi:amino acid transporter
MLLTYALEALAVIAVWQNWRKLSVWLLLVSAMLAATALGLVVVNIGSLYRLRYPFWILLVVLGAGGAVHLFSRPRSRKQRKLGTQTV